MEDLMRSVFISYAREDSGHAARLLEQLHKLHVGGWMDASDIAAGSAFPAAIREALNRASAVLVLVSRSSLNNQWVQFEVGAAEALGKPIIPVLVSGEGDMLADAPALLRERRWLDARHLKAEDIAREIENALP
jgi:hypothetical protein